MGPVTSGTLDNIESGTAAVSTSVADRVRTLEPTIESRLIDSRTALQLRCWERSDGVNRNGQSRTFVFLNGLESHSLWGTFLAEALCERGHRFVGLDRRGSGVNRALRGNARDWVDDVVRVVESERQRNGACPVFLVGQCFGARVAIATAMRRADLVSGLVLLSPGLAMHVDVSLGAKLLIGLGHLLRLPIRLPSPISDDGLMTDDPKWLDYLATDPLRLRRVVVSDLFGGHMLLQSIRRAAARSIPVPCLALFARGDRIVDVDGTIGQLQRLFGEHLAVRTLDEADHLLLFGRAAEKAVASVVEELG